MEPVESRAKVLYLLIASNEPCSAIQGIQFRIPFFRQNQTVCRLGAACYRFPHARIRAVWHGMAADESRSAGTHTVRWRYESVTFSGREVRGALRVQAVRRPSAPGDVAGSWDVVAADATGQPVVTWQGVRLRDVGALVPAGAWHPALFAISMEARAVEFGLDPALMTDILNVSSGKNNTTEIKLRQFMRKA